MGFFKRRNSPYFSEMETETGTGGHTPPKNEYNSQEYPTQDPLHPEVDGETLLQRGLKARHVTMIGMGSLQTSCKID